jgi:hypothetical protein
MSHRDRISLSDIVSLGNKMSELEKDTNRKVRYGEVFSGRLSDSRTTDRRMVTTIKS